MARLRVPEKSRSETSNSHNETGASDSTRRSFLRWSALTGAGASLGALSSIATATELQPAYAAVSATMDSAELMEASISSLQERMAAGELSSRRLVRSYLRRIRKLDRAANCVLEVNPHAISIARDLDRERRRKGPRGPLHGIPLLLKDNIDTADDMMTTAGSLALAGASALQDATVAARLREAGAVILGRANLSEWANFRGFGSSSGRSGVGGQCNNPYILDRNPCGSSSGSAASASANFCAAALGTETDGSVVCPC
ncbi:MAG: amidase family protein [Pseudomonadales bacterium]